LEGERGFGSALPEAGEEHEEEAQLGEEKHGPDARLREHVHRDAGGEDDGGESEESEEEKDGPGFGEVSAECSPCGSEGAADAAVGFGLLAEEGGAELLVELHGVDLDEIEVQTEDGGDKEEEDVAGEDEEEGGASDDAVVDVIGPFALEEKKRAEDETGDEEGEDGDADEAPEIKETLLEECAEAGGGVGLVAEESAGNEEEVNDEKERDGGVTGDGAGVACWALVEMEVGFANGPEIESAGEALGSEGVVEQSGELKVQADGKEEGQGEIEDVGPEERREAAQREREAVEEDVAAFRHECETSGTLPSLETMGWPTAITLNWIKGPKNVVSGDSRDPSLRLGESRNRQRQRWKTPRRK
jgi:hypothetical protein